MGGGARAYRHCERSEAIHFGGSGGDVDCFVASLLAMTGAGRRRRGRRHGLLRLTLAITAARFHVIASRRRSNPSCEARQILVQILPFRIDRFNQRDLLRARAALDLLLAGDGFVHPFVSFVEDQPIAAVAGREARRHAVAMLEDALGEIRGDAGVKRPLAAVGEDVNARRSRQAQLFRSSGRRQGDGLLRRCAPRR